VGTRSSYLSIISDSCLEQMCSPSYLSLRRMSPPWDFALRTKQTDLLDRINGLLTWVGRGFGIHNLTLQLVIGYVFYPVTFFLGVPHAEILTVSQLFATKLVANEFAAYLQLQSLMKTAPLSFRAYTICSYGLCGFANLGSLGIQIGVLSALAPSRNKVIARIAFSAMVCGFLSTLQTAGIV
jgi:CNT family concentrative nucleoside transporter